MTLAFVVKDKLLILAEAQSTWSVNIIPRILLYLAQTLKDWITGNNQNVYGSKKVVFPRPEFYVVYTGDNEKKEIYSLADEFPDGDKSFIDLKVKVIQAGQNRKDIVQQYIAFTRILDQQIKLPGRNEDAVKETIRICKNEDVLKEYLRKREKEVASIMTTRFSQEEAASAYVLQEKAESRVEGIIEGEIEGKREGKEEQAKKTALNLYKKAGMGTKEIAAAIDFDEQTVEKWLGLK